LPPNTPLASSLWDTGALLGISVTTATTPLPTTSRAADQPASASVGGVAELGVNWKPVAGENTQLTIASYCLAAAHLPSWAATVGRGGRRGADIVGSAPTGTFAVT